MSYQLFIAVLAFGMFVVVFGVDAVRGFVLIVERITESKK